MEEEQKIVQEASNEEIKAIVYTEEQKKWANVKLGAERMKLQAEEQILVATTLIAKAEEMLKIE